jgi:hypothetical protein
VGTTTSLRKMSGYFFPFSNPFLKPMSKFPARPPPTPALPPPPPPIPSIAIGGFPPDPFSNMAMLALVVVGLRNNQQKIKEESVQHTLESKH